MKDYPDIRHTDFPDLAGEAGKVGYLIAWLLGVPVWVLLMIYLIRGH